MQRSNELSYEATDVGGWLFVGSYVPVMSESMDEVLCEMNHILNCFTLFHICSSRYDT